MRKAEITRKTKETDISIALSLDGGNIDINTGIGFFDHMLTAFAMHGGFGLQIKAIGDLQVDQHHTVEDVGIVLGQAFFKAMGDKSGIARFGSFYVPMDEALAFAAVDISGRPYLVFDADFPQENCDSYDSCLTWEFMRAFSFNAGITLHTKVLYGNNTHHMTEALFKAVAHALRLALERKENNILLSTKGVL
ncbi:MAG: imidazoleglycerol-phosphate dehydratase HisB [Bacillota bacterium]|nr:imidazoleglycerol-phosphate dehydratase HisB [Bacillota bacterium]